MAPVRRQQIIEATRRCLLRKGFYRVTIQDIAREAGVSTGIPNHYFGSREEILMATLYDTADRVRLWVSTEMDRGTNAREQMELMIHAQSPEHPHVRELWSIWLDYWSEASRDERLATFQSERTAWWIARLQRLIQQGIDEGDFRPGETLDRARRFWAFLDGLSIHCTVGDDAMPASEFVRHTLEYVRRDLYRWPGGDEVDGASDGARRAATTGVLAS
jgi:AcrR family transcriptional regulator